MTHEKEKMVVELSVERGGYWVEEGKGRKIRTPVIALLIKYNIKKKKILKVRRA